MDLFQQQRLSSANTTRSAAVTTEEIKDAGHEKENGSAWNDWPRDTPVITIQLNSQDLTTPERSPPSPTDTTKVLLDNYDSSWQVTYGCSQSTFAQADWNGNLLSVEVLSDQGSSAEAFESCASSFHEDDEDVFVLSSDSNFFRDRSSSDSVMGNKTSSASKAHKRAVHNNPRPETAETHLEPQSPEAISQQTKQSALLGCDSSQQTTTTGIEKSATVETIFRDLNSEYDDGQPQDPSSRSSFYQDVAHHHLFSCDDIVPVAADDDSGSINNAPDLPLDNEPCDLVGVEDVILSEAVKENDKIQENVAHNANIIVEATQQPPAEPDSRSHELEQQAVDQQFPQPSITLPCLKSIQTVEPGLLSRFDYLALEIPITLHNSDGHRLAAKLHLVRLYCGRIKFVSFFRYSSKFSVCYA